MCERTRGTKGGIDWDEVRSVFHETHFPMNMALVQELMDRLEDSSNIMVMPTPKHMFKKFMH
jgi:hypothetical protein